jgi:hypothetical protein
VIDHGWMSNVLRCSDDRIAAAFAKGDGQRLEREMDAAFTLDPVRFLLSSFDRP